MQQTRALCEMPGWLLGTRPVHGSAGGGFLLARRLPAFAARCHERTRGPNCTHVCLGRDRAEAHSRLRHTLHQ